MEIKREDLVMLCPHCKGTGMIDDLPLPAGTARPGVKHPVPCSCRHGYQLTETGQVLKDFMKEFGG